MQTVIEKKISFGKFRSLLNKQEQINFHNNQDYTVKFVVNNIDENIYGLHQASENEITDELVELSEKTLKKDKSLFSNI